MYPIVEFSAKLSPKFWNFDEFLCFPRHLSQRVFEGLPPTVKRKFSEMCCQFNICALIIIYFEDNYVMSMKLISCAFEVNVSECFCRQ